MASTIHRMSDDVNQGLNGGRLKNMTLASMFSVNPLRQLLESTRESEEGSDSNSESMLRAKI